MFYIVGPCSIESETLYIDIAKKIAPIMGDKNWYYKASFDKANRSSLSGGRGPGIEKSLSIFRNVKREIPGIKLTTDIHETWHAKKLVNIIDCIQIPAMLCRQTDLIVSAADNCNCVNIKKGQWMSPENMVKGIDKIKKTNSKCTAIITERGSQFGYGQLIVDFSSVDILKSVFDYVVLDCTHSTQRLKSSGFTGGNPELGLKYMRAASIFEYDGIFIEVHPEPHKSLSDSDSVINLLKFEECIKNL